ncbi:cysteine synthase [Sinomonas cellulolyticus]|uniref:L-cysteine desulfhydrase Cds1 n=1 Tax=Sinomonas cellulolyticus TaxID=2801916 RepID=A0ABS1K4D6_9MICC|nr:MULTISPECIES: pyridoxal-phosphate dependent enzyme [Sinomonas]MBL0706545.1 pyridoxal-phosphate dependent enzyme [Sinomonas cellulolyticus]GHG45220.1 cysteine synthase [Sinomonas sp. KCTC 49339]
MDPRASQHRPNHTPTARRGERAWAEASIRRLEADAHRSADTHLHRVPLPRSWGVDVYLKDESTHRTGSLKHRLARSLFLFALVNGWIREGTRVVEASSGSTAVSEAYFARLIGVPFTAVMTRGTSPEKIALIEQYGGECHFVEQAGEVYAEAARLAEACGGHYLDQFTYAERATDWRGNNNIAETIFDQLALEAHPVPRWIVVGAGTGGTSTTIGRYVRYRTLATELAVADPENSAFYPSWESGLPAQGGSSRIEGIGRPRLEPSFNPSIVDRMFRVPDAASVAAMRDFAERFGFDAGPSTGTSLWAVWQLVAEMAAVGERGSIVTLMCDAGARYRRSYGDDAWLASHGLDPAPHRATLEAFFAMGRWRA